MPHKMFTTICTRQLAAVGIRSSAARSILGARAACTGVYQASVFPTATTKAQQRSLSTKSGDHDPSSIDHLFESNQRWVDETNQIDKSFFEELGKGQAPDFLYIGCSDSRVAISKLTGLDLGNVFVHRNIANMVVSSDLNLLAVLTYAVDHLKVKHILVTGHYDCGKRVVSLEWFVLFGPSLVCALFRKIKVASEPVRKIKI